jgi:ubiquinone/menaquinone biosynthesis C-methylase UbiE
MGVFYKFASHVYRESYRSMIIKEIAGLLQPNVKVLDFGCDDGGIGHRLMKKRPDILVEGIDIQDIRTSKIKRHIYGGGNLPFKDNEFDCVIAIDVLHHLPNKKSMQTAMNEIRRVAKDKIIIKDQIYKTKREWDILKWVDDVTNAEFRIACSYCYNTINEWMDMISTLYPKMIRVLTPRLPIGKSMNPIFDIEL